MTSSMAWEDALAEHREVIGGYRDVIAQLPPASWQRAPTEGKWSPAAVTLHLIQSYELGREGAAGRVEMHMRVSPFMAWASRTFIMPAIFATRRFPRGAKAPREVRPDPVGVAALGVDDALARLLSVAGEAAEGLRQASAALRVRHAYFGHISAFQALRMLSAHTRHHTRELTR